MSREAYRQPAQQLPGYKTLVSLPSEKGLPAPTSGNPEYNYVEQQYMEAPEHKVQVLPKPPDHNKNRDRVLPEAVYNVPGGSDEAVDGKPLSTKPVQIPAIPGEQYGDQMIDQGHTIKQRRPQITAGVFPQTRQREQGGKAKRYYGRKYRRTRQQKLREMRKNWRTQKRQRKVKMKRKMYRKFPHRFERKRGGGVRDPAKRTKDWRKENPRQVEQYEKKERKRASFEIPLTFEDYDVQGRVVEVDIDNETVTLDVDGTFYDVPYDFLAEQVENEETFEHLMEYIFDHYPEEDDPMEKEAVRMRPVRRQRRQKGMSKIKSKQRYRKNRQKYKQKAKLRYKKNKNRPNFKRQRKVRRKHPQRFRRRTGNVLTAPDIAFVIGRDLQLGYVHSVSPMTGLVTFYLKDGEWMSLPVPVFLCAVSFLSEEDIDAMFQLIDAEADLGVYADITPEAVAMAADLEGIDIDGDGAQTVCEKITGIKNIDDMMANELYAVDTALLMGIFEDVETPSGVEKDSPHNEQSEETPQEEAEEKAEDRKIDPLLVDPTEDEYIYGIVHSPEEVAEAKEATFYRKTEPPSDMPMAWDRKKDEATPSGDNQRSQSPQGTTTWVVPTSSTPSKLDKPEPQHPAQGIQQPAVSGGSSAKVIPYNTDRVNHKEWPVDNHFRQAYRIASRHKVAIKMAEISESTGSEVHQRSDGLGVKLKKADRRNAMWTFAVQGSKGPHKVRIKAVPKGNIKNLKAADIHVSCSCAFWQWQGPEHWAKQNNYLYGTPRGTASKPDIKDPSGTHWACKHVLAALRHAAGYAMPLKKRKMGSVQDEHGLRYLADRIVTGKVACSLPPEDGSMEMAERIARRHLAASGMVANIVKAYRKYRDVMEREGKRFQKEMERAFPDTRFVTYFGIEDECVVGIFYLEAEGGGDPMNPQDDDFPGDAIIATAQSILGVRIDDNDVEWKRDMLRLEQRFDFIHGG